MTLRAMLMTAYAVVFILAGGPDLWVGTAASGQDYSSESSSKTKTCTLLVAERVAARKIQDWTQLAKICQRFIMLCSGVLEDRYVADAHGDSSDAHYKLGDWGEALDHANSCIDLFYFATFCHTSKFMILVELGKLEEAKKSFRVAEQVIIHAARQNQLDVDNADNEAERDLYRSMAGDYQLSSRIVELYRPLLGNR